MLGCCNACPGTNTARVVLENSMIGRYKIDDITTSKQWENVDQCTLS